MHSVFHMPRFHLPRIPVFIRVLFLLCLPVAFLFYLCLLCVCVYDATYSFMFGGAGTLVGGIRPIFSEFWQYVPTTGVWVPLNALPVINALAPPVGRYGSLAHTTLADAFPSTVLCHTRYRVVVSTSPWRTYLGSAYKLTHVAMS